MIDGRALTASPVALRPHPRFRQSAIEGITVEGARTDDDGLRIRYVVTGALDRIKVAPSAPSLRRDNLWRTTCFEAFLMTDDVPGYHEGNFSPSGEWAAYSFDGYRTNMRTAAIAAPPRISAECSATRLALSVKVDSSWIPPDLNWRVGLSAVIEADDGTLSYWALAHPPGNPDFHHRDCFALELAATDAS